MNTTLDDCLAEVDSWKQAAIAELLALSPEQRDQRLQEVRRQFEEATGRMLRVAAAVAPAVDTSDTSGPKSVS